MTSAQLEVIFNDHFYKAVLMARKIVANTEIAEDIVQDVFVKMLRRSSIDNPARYLYASVRNAAIDHLNKKNAIRLKQDKIPWETTEVTEYHLSEEENEYINKLDNLFKAIETLPGGAREVIRLICFERYSYKEAAEELRIPVATVKTYMYRSMKIFRKKLLP